MREIKFKVWCKENEQFIQFNKMGFLEDGSLWYAQGIDENEKETDPPYFENQNDWELMQYTGLKDKNGVEIYEGDVLTSNVQPCKMVNPIKYGYGVVRFENGMFKLGAISLATFISKMEVIGNIYENQELLECEAE